MVQNEATCVVFGMPRSAIEAGASDEVVPLEVIAEAVARYMRGLAGRFIVKENS